MPLTLKPTLNSKMNEVLRGTNPYERLGTSVARHGDTALFGGSNRAVVLQQQGSGWVAGQELLGLVPSAILEQRPPLTQFGWRVALSENRAAVLANSPAAAFLFKRDDTSSFVFDTVLRPADVLPTGPVGRFTSVALTDTLLALGASDLGGPGGTGAVYAPGEAGDWKRRLVLQGRGEERLGRSTAIDGDSVMFGAPNGERSSGPGRVVLTRQAADGLWEPVGELRASAIEGLATFGASLAVNGDTLAVGASTAGGVPLGVGEIRVFQRNGPDWVEAATATLPRGELDRHGMRVGNDVAVMADGSVAATAVPEELGDTAYLARWAADGRQDAEIGTFASEPGSAPVVAEGNDLLIGSSGANPTYSPTARGAVFAANDLFEPS